MANVFSGTPRRNIQDFMSAVRLAPGLSGNFDYGATLNTDGSVQITQTPVKGGVAVVLYAGVLWNAQGAGTNTDANSNSNDTVTILGGTHGGASTNSEPGRVGDCQAFLVNLP